MEKRILQVRKLSDALRVRLKELKKSDADLLLNLALACIISDSESCRKRHLVCFGIYTAY